MPPESPKEIADRALLAALAATRAAEKAADAAEKARTVAEVAKATVETIRLEIVHRLDRQDEESEKWRRAFMLEVQASNRNFDAFKTDFNKVEQRSVDNEDQIHGNEKKNIIGIIPIQRQHETFRSRLKTQVALVGTLLGFFSTYMFVFHLEDMKRGIFNPAEDDIVRIANRVVQNWFPDAKWPRQKPPPDKP